MAEARDWFKFEQSTLYAVDVSALEDEEQLDMAVIKRVTVADWLRETPTYLCASKTPARLYIVVSKPAPLKRKAGLSDKLISIAPMAQADTKITPKRSGEEKKHQLKKITTKTEEAAGGRMSPLKLRTFMSPSGRPGASPSKHAATTAAKQRKEDKTGRVFNFNDYNYGLVSIYKKTESSEVNRRGQNKQRAG